MQRVLKAALSTMTTSGNKIRYADIGANLTDTQFQGWYHGKQKHEADLDQVLNRADQMGVEKILVTGSTLEESKQAIELCKNHHRPDQLFCTVGVHPCQSTHFETAEEGAEEHLKRIEQLAIEGKSQGVVKAFGEIGLDYDRLHFAPAETQRIYFEKQLEIATRVGLPLFLHSRACREDFHSILSKYLDKIPHGGVVHSFTGSLEEMKDYVGLGLYIGINGCSLKTQENLDVVKEIPLDRLILETDGPWCEIRPSHESHKQFLVNNEQIKLPFDAVKKEKFKSGAMIRGRCEPCAIQLVAQVVAGVKNLSLEDVAHAAWENTMHVYEL